jgi:cytochrome c2
MGDSTAMRPDTTAALAPEPTPPPSLALDASADGQSIFRHDTFGNEAFWTDTLRLNEIVQQKLDPTTALELGLKVDAEALPQGALEGADLKSPATTLVLLKANAVVGIRAIVDDSNHITRLGVTCALCHSTVDNSVQQGIGRRLDGWPNRDINVGAIIALSPSINDEQRAVFTSWGPGKYDPYFNQDGKNFPVVIPPAYGLAKIENATYTAAGSISFWNQYVAVTQMHGVGPAPSREGEGAQPVQPVPMNQMPEKQDTAQRDAAPAAGMPAPAAAMPVQQSQDLVTAKLPALRDYQHGLEVPANADSVNHASATRGERVFKRACQSCHVGVTGTDNNAAAQAAEVTPGGGLRKDGTAVMGKVHAPAETGQDPKYAERTASSGYRTTPLRGLATHAPYFHDGSAATLEDVVQHYNKNLKLKLTARQQKDLVEFLKTK